jgi:hypothetical protein
VLFCSTDRVLELIAKEGLPACNKTGRGWVFVDVDLIEWLRAHYAGRAHEQLACPPRPSLAAIQRRYTRALEQATRRKPKQQTADNDKNKEGEP